jgi:hypothetical protein
MRNLLLTALLLAAVSATMVPHLGPIEAHTPRTYKMELSDPPLTRWAPIARDYKEPLSRFMDYLDLLPIPKTFYDGVEHFARTEFKYQDFVAEIDALATLSGYPFEKIFFFNFFYEFSTIPVCTGFLVRNKAGTVMHGRNLDFEMWELLSKLLVTLDYYKDGNYVFTHYAVAGSVFSLTGTRPGAFSVNVDTRGARSLQTDLISIIKDNAIPTCWLLRKVFEEETSYAAASQRLRTQHISAPVYFIVAGVEPNEGMVIERDTNATHAFYQLSDETWFLVQTNYDRDQPEPVYDQRRIPMEHRVQKRGQNFTHETVLEEMFTWPNFNIATIMTAVMVPGQKYKNVTAWYGLNPSEKQLSAE